VHADEMLTAFLELKSAIHRAAKIYNREAGRNECAAAKAN
jgi:hypothetical protein